MEIRILWKANLKRHAGSLCGIFLLLLLVSASLATVLTIRSNSGRYVEQEMDRMGYGNLSAWVSGISDVEPLISEIVSLEDAQSASAQQIIFTEYEIGEQESDSEGQLIAYDPEEVPYKIFQDDLSGYLSGAIEIAPEEIYVSPSMVSMFGLTVGDTITFPIARSGVDKTFVVRGYFEDPFMGSSMIGMKGFLICREDYDEINDMIESAGNDGLARSGYMLHIFQTEESGLSAVQWNAALNQNTTLSRYVEFTHSRAAIAGFMLTLQNVFTAFLLAFTAILAIVALIVLGHSMGSSIEQDYVNMGILKTMGFSGRRLREIQLLQYLPGIVPGIAGGLLLSLPAARSICRITVTTTGLLIPSDFPAGLCLSTQAVLLLLLVGFIWMKAGRIRRISPMTAIRDGADSPAAVKGGKSLLRQEGLGFWLALRQLLTGKKRYLGAGMVALLLVFFASMLGRVNAWLGPNGEGLMDAFNPADLHIAAQPVGEAASEDVEQLIRRYTGITDQYMLAMPSVSAQGVDYTANVITQPGRFHMLEGRTCENPDEVVLTEFAAADLGVSIGDTITLTGNLASSEYTVSGIYQCANDMGANLGLSREGYNRISSEGANIWCTHYFLEDESLQPEIMQALEDTFGGDVYLHENSWPGLYGILSAMRLLMIFLYVIVLVFVLVTTLLTASKLLTAEQKDFGIFKAIGFTGRQLRLSFALRFGIAAALGSIPGTALSAYFTDPLVAVLMRMEGISNFSSHPGILAALLPGAVVILAFVLFAYLAAKRINKIPLSVLAGE